jgi:hypothetical protein
MALMSSPEPMPVEVTAAAGVVAADVVLVVGVVLVVVVVGDVLLEMAELMIVSRFSYRVLSAWQPRT